MGSSVTIASCLDSEHVCVFICRWPIGQNAQLAKEGYKLQVAQVAGHFFTCMVSCEMGNLALRWLCHYQLEIQRGSEIPIPLFFSSAQ